MKKLNFILLMLMTTVFSFSKNLYAESFKSNAKLIAFSHPSPDELTPDEEEQEAQAFLGGKE